MAIILECTNEVLASTAKGLKSGALLGMPTETVYGLAGDAENADAIARIYKVKERPQNHPVIVHIGSLDHIDLWAREIPEYAHLLARDFWPGPMTLVLQRTALAKDFITGGQETVAIRIPAHPIALKLLNSFHAFGGKGLAAPSANRFGAVSPTSAQAVEAELGQYLDESRDVILEGGSSLVGLESTIIDCTGNHPRILRPGAITAEMVRNATGLKVEDFTFKEINKSADGRSDDSRSDNKDEEIRVPGSLENHYSPKAEVRVNCDAKKGDGFIALVHVQTPEGAIRLASPKDLDEYARILYQTFRAADAQKISRIVVIAPEGDGLALAIRERVTRAAR